MIPAWGYLDEQDRGTFQAVVAFLRMRLSESSTIDWAVRLTPSQRIERIAIEHLLDNRESGLLSEPWASTWRLIEESWSSPPRERGPSTAIYGIRGRLRMGDRSGALIKNIVKLVAPSLSVEPFESERWKFTKKPARPSGFEHLISAKLTSGDLVDLEVLGLADLSDSNFLKALASALESAVVSGLGIARRLGWDGDRRLWQLGGLGRVYYMTAAPRAGGKKDPDAFHRGIAPAVKLLFAVVNRIGEINSADAVSFIRRWQLMEDPIHLRLWAAAARDARLVGSGDVQAFFTNLNNRRFWDLHEFPEIAELRALRYNDLDVETQKNIVARIRRGPPRSHWPKGADVEKVRDARLYWSIRELKRIDVAGGALPEKAILLINSNLDRFDNLSSMNIYEGMPESSEFYAIPSRPDPKYETLTGATRLRALEAALAATRSGWDDDPGERANDWLQQEGKSLLVLHDLENEGSAGDAYQRLWNRFGWAHSPRIPSTSSTSARDLQAETDRVLALLEQLSDGTLLAAIEGISAWLDNWTEHVVRSELLPSVWLRIWPIAVKATNAEKDSTDEDDLTVVADDGGAQSELDTLNNPAGKLVGVFLATCPSLTEVPHPFATSDISRKFRDTVIRANGRSGLIVRHRLIEALPYFLRADRSWTEEYLVRPLFDDDAASRALWQAIARRTHFTAVLRIIGDTMAEKATDRRLDRETRRRLVFSLVIESLHAFRENREPAVANQRVQQMLRVVDDEVRASAANAVQQFLRDLSADESAENCFDAADLFRSAAIPFFRRVWPQERSLATPGVSGALADLPATTGEAFAEAVETVERFLVPFDCWSMLDYGLYSKDGDERKLDSINTEAKVRALLRLLDLTVGTSEGAVVPRDLSEALDQMRSVVPQMVKDPVYRRLSTVARR